MVRKITRTSEYVAPRADVLEILAEQVFAGSYIGNGFDDVPETDYEW